MTEKDLLVLIALVATSTVVLATSEVGDGRQDSRSTSAGDGDQEPSTSSLHRRVIASRPVAVVDGGYWTVRRQREVTGVVNSGNSTTESRLTADQWRRRERSVARLNFTLNFRLSAGNLGHMQIGRLKLLESFSRFNRNANAVVMPNPVWRIRDDLYIWPEM